MKKLTICLLVVVFAATLAGHAFAKDSYTIATVVKLDGIAWFDRMREGVEQFGEDTGHEAFLQGPPKADAALQVQIIEDLIAQSVDAICVVPFSPEALEPVLKKAMDQGIVVISHEAVNQQNVHYDLEAFVNEDYGAHIMDHLAKFMGEEGEFAVTVGSLTSKSHNQWVDGGLARQAEKYPNMKVVTERLESYDDQTKAYEITKELLKKYPNLKGMQTSAMPTSAGAGLAIEEKGLQDKFFIVGTGLVSVSGQYLESGAVKMITFWDPFDAGYAMNRMAVMVLEGQEITEGMDLGVKGYTNVNLDGKIVYGSAWVDVTTENMDEYDF